MDQMIIKFFLNFFCHSVQCCCTSVPASPPSRYKSRGRKATEVTRSEINYFNISNSFGVVSDKVNLRKA